MLCTVVGAGGCGGGTTQAPPDASTAARARVREFWAELRAATAARVARDFGQAAELYEKALALDATHEEPLYYLGQCRRELAEPEAARAAFERLVEVNPMSARGEMALGALLASPDPAEPMDLDEAERHLRRAHELNTEETGPLVRLGEVLIVAARPDEAREWLEAALLKNPKSLEAALLTGYLAWEAEGARGRGPSRTRAQGGHDRRPGQGRDGRGRPPRARKGGATPREPTRAASLRGAGDGGSLARRFGRGRVGGLAAGGLARRDAATRRVRAACGRSPPDPERPVAEVPAQVGTPSCSPGCARSTSRRSRL
jgi:tetratricopeptide (TPR) repeat protein